MLHRLLRCHGVPKTIKYSKAYLGQDGNSTVMTAKPLPPSVHQQNVRPRIYHCRDVIRQAYTSYVVMQKFYNVCLKQTCACLVTVLVSLTMSR